MCLLLGMWIVKKDFHMERIKNSPSSTEIERGRSLDENEPQNLFIKPHWFLHRSAKKRDMVQREQWQCFSRAADFLDFHFPLLGFPSTPRTSSHHFACKSSFIELTSQNDPMPWQKLQCTHIITLSSTEALPQNSTRAMNVSFVGSGIHSVIRTIEEQ